jgi:hypothetical protein
LAQVAAYVAFFESFAKEEDCDEEFDLNSEKVGPAADEWAHLVILS